MADSSGGPAQGTGACMQAHWDRAAGSQPAASALGLQSIGGGSRKQLFSGERTSPERTSGDGAWGIGVLPKGSTKGLSCFQLPDED